MREARRAPLPPIVMEDCHFGEMDLLRDRVEASRSTNGLIGR